jgi:gliding motility-associated-like protein
MIFSMKRIFLIFFLLLVADRLYAQCFQITSILVDACGSPEGPNEMVRFKVGNTPIAVNDIAVNWPNNPFLGFCQNTTTEQIIIDLNSTIVSCGYFLEPSNGILPADADVLMITSTDFDPTAHSYEGLQDTIYVIFQCPGNTSGHFANWVNGCDPATGERTLTMSIAPNCLQSVTYNRCFLVNQTGGIGGTAAQRDGARVDFDQNGNATYANDGCVLPIENFSVEIVNPVGPIQVCSGETVVIDGQINGNQLFFEWSWNNIQLDTVNLIGFNYTVLDSADHYLYLSGLNGCGELVTDSIWIQVLSPLPEYLIEVNDEQPFCQVGDAEIAVLTNATFVWQDGSTDNPYVPVTEGWYYVTFESACGNITDSVYIAFDSPPSCEALSGNVAFCSGDSILISAVSSSADTWGWDGNFNNSNEFWVSQGGNYVFSALNACGQCTIEVIATEIEVNAFFTVSETLGTAPLVLDVQDLSVGGNVTTWTLNGSFITVDGSNSITLNQPGIYVLELEVYDSLSGCSSMWIETIEVILDFDFFIPNIFTPNNDAVNDFFLVESSMDGLLTYSILNRWGNVMRTGEVIMNAGESKILWDGTDENSGSFASSGVYFYHFEFNSEVLENQTIQGFFHLNR